MPHNSLTQDTVYYTANSTDTSSNGTGTVIEVICHSSEEVVRISGFAHAVADLNLPSNHIDDSLFFEKTITPKIMKKMGKKSLPRGDIVSIIHRGNEYITVCVPLSVINRHQLHDRLNGLGWQMKGYSVQETESGSTQSEMWFKVL